MRNERKLHVRFSTLHKVDAKLVSNVKKTLKQCWTILIQQIFDVSKNCFNIVLTYGSISTMFQRGLDII